MTDMGCRLTSLVLAVAAAGLPASAAEIPPWAFPVNPPGIQPAPDDGSQR